MLHQWRGMVLASSGGGQDAAKNHPVCIQDSPAAETYPPQVSLVLDRMAVLFLIF